ncbi:bile acid:Na+ symporter, BASS family [Muriicola jejuensis]|uniref:Bile acid:sodium symporter family protein n=1 Tax=Muriicola jejuensis TaxID=504488 RepID=A0A6P0UDL9_9FLAO|nr:bile acid:sodium symporter family protein [Muriicola jejuensis]NER10712.1 bile acid:sodium symporter family protein [Muriicola jejuensis]SMP16618.1 bile acid:Na+ symporter, BASS family [Muriicola jejuensis]
MVLSSLDEAHINFSTETLWILNVILALVMFGVALHIRVRDFKALLRDPRSLLVGVFCQFLALPLVTFLLVIAFRPQPSLALGMILVAACPGGNISNFITSLGGGNRALSVALTANATLLAILFTPLNLGFWGSLYPPAQNLLRDISLNPLEMVEIVALILGLPLLAGVWLHERFPELARRLAKVLKHISLLFFGCLILFVLYNNRVQIREYLLLVFWLVVLQNAMAFLTGYTAARLAGLPSEDIRCITIETGIQNSGLGLVLIFTFFEGLGGMAVLTAFWGVWHLISGMLLGSFWAFRPLRKEVGG